MKPRKCESCRADDHAECLSPAEYAREADTNGMVVVACCCHAKTGHAVCVAVNVLPPYPYRSWDQYPDLPF